MQRASELPEPPEMTPVRRSRLWKRLALVALLAVLVVAAIRVPIPVFYSYLPGPVRDVEGLVTVEGVPTFASEGGLFLTTVSVDVEVTFVEMIGTIFDSDSRLVTRDQVTGGADLEAVEREQFVQMQRSQQAAIEVAFAALGLGAPTAEGVRIEELTAGTDAARFLKPGDRILEVDGAAISTTCDVGRGIDEHSPGERVDITVRRGGRRHSFDLRTVPNPQDPNSPLLGVFMSDIDFEFETDIEVSFETGEIAGPSAGLMMTLALYDKLTPEDLTGGRAIAGTGEIACDGGVGPIGGIEQKVAGAEMEGAEIFLAPAANFEAALAAAGDIRVVAVSNFSDAVEFLEGG